jgi:hypothetical protein
MAAKMRWRLWVGYTTVKNRLSHIDLSRCRHSSLTLATRPFFNLRLLTNTNSVTGAAGFADSALFCSAAPIKIAGTEQTTNTAIAEEQRDARSKSPSFSRTGASISRHENEIRSLAIRDQKSETWNVAPQDRPRQRLERPLPIMTKKILRL